MRNTAQDEILFPPRPHFHGERRIVEIDLRDSRYEAFVNSHPSALIYHHPVWLEVLTRENPGKPICLASQDDAGRLYGILPLLPTRGLPFGGQLAGRRVSSLPRTPVAGPLACDAQAAAALIRAAKNYVPIRGTRLQIKVKSNDLDGIVDDVMGGRWRQHYVLELPDRVEDLRLGSSRSHARIRSTVNKASTLNLRVRESESESDLRAWYELYLETMRWHVVPPRPYRFFQAAWDLMRPRGFLRLLLAELTGHEPARLLAGSIFLPFGSTFFYAFNGASRKYTTLSPNDVIQWRAVHDACKEGYRYFDLGEVPDGCQGLADFKRKWSSRQTWLYRYYYPKPPEFETGKQSASLTAKLMKRIWRKVPIKATAVAGDWIYRYL
ncbi:MAG TPA: GNAT family N-acetyltransferase [Terriglobia bacterium]|jgi:hypothetical protein